MPRRGKVVPITTPTEHPERNSASQEHPQLYAEQIRLLYSNALIGLIATLINSGVLVFILRNVSAASDSSYLACLHSAGFDSALRAVQDVPACLFGFIRCR